MEYLIYRDDLLINQFVKNKGVLFEVSNSNVMLIGTNTCIHKYSSTSHIIINEVKLPEELSAQLNYLIGSLNFFGENLFKIPITEYRDIIIENASICIKLIYDLNKANDINLIGNVINDITAKKIELRDKFYKKKVNQLLKLEIDNGCFTKR